MLLFFFRQWIQWFAQGLELPAHITQASGNGKLTPGKTALQDCS